jgi:YVTN family beta-propeller protein/autotransporter-associated beta strand protein
MRLNVLGGLHVACVLLCFCVSVCTCGTASAQQGPFVYVPNAGSNNVSVIDSSTNTVAAGTISTGNGPQGAAVRGDEAFVYVTNQTSNTVSVIDTATNTAVATITVGNTPGGIAVAPNGKTIYVSNGSSNTVSAIDAITNTVIATVPVGTNPSGVAFTPDGKTAYVGNFSSNNVSVINTATNTVVTTILVGANPLGVALTPDGKFAYVTNFGSNNVSVINTTTNTVAALVAVGNTPIGVVVTPNGSIAYVVNVNSNTISIIDTATNIVVGGISVGNFPRGVALSPDGKTLYVTNIGNNTVSVIDTASSTVTATLPVGANPGVFPGVCTNGNALLATGLTFVAHTSGALGCTLASGPAGSPGPVFTGGTLQIAGAGISSALPINLSSLGGMIDTNGFNATLSGGIGGPGGLTKTGVGTLTLSGSSTYSGPTFVNVGTLQAGVMNTFSASSAFNVATGAILDLNNLNQIIGSLAGTGSVALGSATLTAGGDNTSTTFAGVLSGVGGGFTKTGTGTTILTRVNTYTGGTTVNAGVLDVEGSIAASNLTTVSGGLLMGTGSVGNTLIANGGTFAPGSGAPGSSMTVAGNLAFQSGAIYMVQLNPSTASFANITGTATLNGATSAIFANGNFVAKQYTILSATGGVNGTFSSLINTNLSPNFNASLSYDANHAFLNLVLKFVPPPSSGLSVNQQNVANAIVGFFNRNNGIPLVYGGLTGAGLTQASGETATGTQQTTFDAMNLFLGLLTDPFVAGRGNGISSTPVTPQFADGGDGSSAYAANGKSRSKPERDAYAAIYKKALPPAIDPFAPRWSVWAAGYGGSQTTDGNAALGSNTVTSRVYGTAVGADYRFSPNTLAGFALAGGGTNFGIVNGLGSGRSDLFQAGAFARHTAGPAYISAALAYGWQDITTDRTVTIAGVDQLRGKFNANAFSGRLEGGYRFVTPWMGITPYAAGQFTTFDLPAYAEQVLAGANTFALSYGAKEVTASRSELGLRSDKSFAMDNAILTLRGRAAWAHNFDADRSIGATFQALPGASFVVNGAAQASDAALATASAEMKWTNGFSLAATFEGEFSNTTRSYAGKGVVRYAW